MTRLGNLVWFCVGIVVLLVNTSTAGAQLQQPQQIQESSDLDWHFRYELFQALLEQQNLRPVSSPLDATKNPSKSVVVALGRISTITPAFVDHFCRNGGTMLLASDTQQYLGSMCSFRQGAVTTPGSVAGYQGHRDCIQITNFAQDQDLLAGVGSLVVNKSGWLEEPRFRKTELNVIARLPSDVMPSRSRDAPFLATVENPKFPNGSKLIVCSDQSLFTNGMLWHGDNSLLAINIASALASGERDTLYFAVDGRPLSSYLDSPLVNQFRNQNLPLPDNLPEPEPDLKTMLRLANAVAKNVQESNLVNEVLASRPRNTRPPYYRRGLLFLLGALVVAFIIWKLSANSANPDDAMPDRRMRTAYDIQSDRKIKSSEFGYAASMLARDLCRELTDSGDRAVWLRKLKPLADVDKPAKTKTSQEIALSGVVDLAVNSQTVHISRKRFEAIGRTIQEIRTLHREEELTSTPS